MSFPRNLAVLSDDECVRNPIDAKLLAELVAELFAELFADFEMEDMAE